ncbi:MAG TPA: TIGR02300 family protein [Xanthobacteraceae bacterium]|nr:TIGR02300 family protein [Xanthobacteraceae bacterium]
MAKAELGTKRLCANCGAKFYDLNKDPIHCPKCGTVHEVAPVVTRARPEAAPVVPRPPVPAEEVAVPETAEVETVSLEEADAEAQGKKPAAAEPGAEDEDVEIDETLDDDDTFIEEQEEEDADVTDIIGGDIEPEEEG